MDLLTLDAERWSTLNAERWAVLPLESAPNNGRVISGRAYFAVARAYSMAWASLMTARTEASAAADTVVRITDIEQTLELLPAFYGCMQSSSQFLSSTIAIESAVRSLQSHVARRSSSRDVVEYIQTEIIDAGLADGVPAEWAAMSKGVGFDIDHLIEPE